MIVMAIKEGGAVTAVEFRDAMPWLKIAHSLTGTNSNTICRLIDVRLNQFKRFTSSPFGIEA